jgi:hypothetical protein
VPIPLDKVKDPVVLPTSQRRRMKGYSTLVVVNGKPTTATIFTTGPNVGRYCPDQCQARHPDIAMLKPRIRSRKSDLTAGVKVIAQCNDSNVSGFACRVLKYHVRFGCKLSCSISPMLATSGFSALRSRLCPLPALGLIRPQVVYILTYPPVSASQTCN